MNCQSLNIQYSVREKKNQQKNPNNERVFMGNEKKKSRGGREQRNSAKCFCTSGFQSPLQYRQGVAPGRRGGRAVLTPAPSLSSPSQPAPLVRCGPGANTEAGDPRASRLPQCTNCPSNSPRASSPATAHPTLPSSQICPFLFSHLKRKGMPCRWALRTGAPLHCHPGGLPTPPEAALAPSPTPVLNISAACKRPRPARDPRGSGRPGGH